MINHPMRHRGFEPRTTWLKVKCSTDWANTPEPLKGQCPEPESNQWHEDFQSSALPTELSGHLSSGDRIWTYDLRVMSPTSFQTAPPRDNNYKNNGWRRIRTFESVANRFTVCPLWPLGNPSIKPTIGLEPITCWLQVSCSANWATSALLL